MLGGKMGTLTKKLPKGGETIYEVMYIGRWMHENYASMAKAVMNFLFLSHLPEKEHRRYYVLMKRHVEAFDAATIDPEFVKSSFMLQRMPYGSWVDRDLARGLFSRIEVVIGHPAWSNFHLKDQVRLVAEMIFEAMTWSGTLRAAVWNGEPRFEEPEYYFIDQWHGRHLFTFKDVPVTTRFGYVTQDEE
jgi:hypothetical protein